jgi:glyoxylase-like metal-dependent hydrolase (beta-lactamase superfamily II)
VPNEIVVTGELQAEAWTTRTMPPVEKLATDLWSIPVPMAEGPLRYTSVYVLADDTGVTLVDSGWDSDEAFAALQDGLIRLGGSLSDVTGCLITHLHPDHLGLAGRIRDASGSWVALHPADAAMVARPEFREPGPALTADLAWLRRLGASHDTIDASGWRLTAVHTPGHTAGHLCFSATDRGILFAGDHLLPRISPNIGASRHHDDDPLGDFFTSLDAIRAVGDAEVLPGHEWRFRGIDARTSQLRRHHALRLEELLAAVHAAPGATPWELAPALRWSRDWSQYDGWLKLSAVSETTAHLQHLVAIGRVVRVADLPMQFRCA